MRILMIANYSVEKCGERVYAEIWAGELRKLGVEVLEWDGAEPASLPHDYSSYDLLHFNWGPQQMGHWGEQHLPPDSPPVSIFLHDVPPNSGCFLLPRASLLMSHEVMEGSHVIPHAIPDYLPKTKQAEEVTVGVTGIRGDPGPELVRAACEERGWKYSPPPWWSGREWLSVEEEIERLAASTLNVCWYHTSGRGRSMGAKFCLAARRPLLLSGSTMFEDLWPYSDEIMIVRDSHEEGRYAETLAPSLDLAFAKIEFGWQGGAPRALEDLSWAKCAERIKGLWEGVGR